MINSNELIPCAARSEFPESQTYTQPSASGLTAPSGLYFGPPTAKGPLGKLASYHLLRELGAGAFGVVFQAYDESLDQQVAIKVLRPERAASSEDRARFEREGRKAAAVKHDHVVIVHAVGQTADSVLPYLVMEYIEGEPLSARLEREGALPPREAARIVRELSLGLAAAHAGGQIHRDIKPANVMIERATGRAKITDFGLARRVEANDTRLTQAGAVVGTPAYMSPEQIVSPDDIDARSDLYSLGVMLYELLTEQRPFQGATALDIFHQVLSDEPRPPRRLNGSVPHDLETIALKCLAKEPAQRYPSAGELAEDLRRFLADEPIQARPVGRWERAWRWARRHPAAASAWALGVLAAALLLVGGGVTLLWRQTETLRQEADTARQAAADARDRLEIALKGEQEAKEQLGEVVALHRVSLAHDKWNANSVQQAEQLLLDCPPEHRGWEWHYVFGLLHSDLLTFRGHTNYVHRVAFHPDGKRVASAAIDGAVKVWDAGTGKVHVSFTVAADSIDALAFTPDGARLVTASCIFDKKSNRYVGAVKGWDIGTGQVAFTLEGYDSRVTGVALSPDGSHLATAGADAMLRLWDARTGAEGLIWKGDTQAVYAVAFSRDGKSLASGGSDGTVRIWNARTGEAIRTLKLPDSMLVQHSLAFSPDGKHLASGSEYQVMVWEFATGKLVRSIRPPRTNYSPAACLRYSPDGKRLALAGSDHTVRVWDSETGEACLTLKGHTRPVVGIDFSPDGSRLVSASIDKTVKVWEAGRDQESVVIGGFESNVASQSFNRDGTRLATASGKKVQVWDTATGRELLKLGALPADVGCVAFSPADNRLATGIGGSVMVFDDRGKELLSLQGPRPTAGGVFGVSIVSFSPDGKRLLATSVNRATVWDAVSGIELLYFEEKDEKPSSVAVSRDLNTVVYCSDNGTANVWDTATGRKKGAFKIDMHMMDGHEIGPEGRRLVAISADPDLPMELWDTLTGKRLLRLKGHTLRAWDAAFSPDGKRLVSGSMDGTLKLWHPVFGHELLTLRANGEDVQKVVFSPDGHRLAATTLLTVYIWDATPRPDRLPATNRGK